MMNKVFELFEWSLSPVSASVTFLTPWDPDSCCSTRPSGLKALDTGWNDETRVSVVIIVSAEIGMPLLLLSIFIMILCNIVLSELWVLPVSSEAESSSLGTSEHKVRFNHLTLQEERLWVWDENYIDTQLHYNNHNTSKDFISWIQHHSGSWCYLQCKCSWWCCA